MKNVEYEGVTCADCVQTSIWWFDYNLVKLDPKFQIENYSRIGNKKK